VREGFAHLAQGARQLGIAATEGIDVLVDTVGGKQLTAARRGARSALVGALSGQSTWWTRR
jgi:NADPH-dependent curcumin reductase CurA